MFYVYLLQHNESKKTYIGYTADLRRRVREHNAKGDKFTTTNSGKWILKYYEAYASEKDARLRETRLKGHGSAKQKLVLRISSSLDGAQN